MSRFGKEVTAEFPEAVRADLRVFKGKKRFTVVDGDEPDEPLPRGSNIPTAEWVRKFIAALLTPHAGGDDANPTIHR